MYLDALLDVRINKLANFPSSARHYSQKFSDAGFADIKQIQFDGVDSFFTKRYCFLDVYPSLIAYLNRLFVDGEYKFQNEIEPPYINRNWILHGRCSREIARYECIQVLNALDMIEKILGCNMKESPPLQLSHKMFTMLVKDYLKRRISYAKGKNTINSRWLGNSICKWEYGIRIII